MIFWDASAVVPLLLDEPESAAMRELVGDDPWMIVWWGTSLECLSAIARRQREGELPRASADLTRSSLAELRDTWSEVAPSEQVREHASRLVLRHPLRAADALQLGAALVWARSRPRDHGFCSLDERLAEAARQEGFAVRAGS